jgi:peptidoglycan/xylan/chitin deacetylase (PgdA/CDA1 family)
MSGPGMRRSALSAESTAPRYPLPGEGRKSLAIMYHEVVEDGDSRIAKMHAGDAVYKLDESDFREHLAAIKKAIGEKPVRRADDPAAWGEGPPLFLTFDDGEASGYTRAAPALEEYGWRGHFFITAGQIGRPNILTPWQIRELDRRGHLIGSHSYSHPPAMSQMGWDELRREWSESVRVLEATVAHAVTVGSVPGGYYAPRVAEAAALAGIRVLFTSEPTMAAHRVGDCLVLGRYFVQRGMAPRVSAAFASGRVWSRSKQALGWKARKMAKSAAGGVYASVRERWLAAGKTKAA